MAGTTERQAWMSVLARAPAAELERLGGPHLPSFTRLRGPETGLVMLRGRAGGTGAPFNLGEATATRCTVRTESGVVGHGYCLGRDGRQAELAAALDAVLQDEEARPAVREAVIEPLRAAQAEARALAARRAGATRVDFSTLATMRS